jgi:hypothetical protein
MLSLEFPTTDSRLRVRTAELDSTAETAARIDAADLALLVVAGEELHPAFEVPLERVHFWRPHLVSIRVRPEAVDVRTLWFQLDALTKIRRMGLPEDRMMLGFYLFEEGRLRGWHPLARFAGLWVEQLLTRRRP